MKRYILFISFLSLLGILTLLILFSNINYYRENFEPAVQSIVLLGDSILKNNAYVNGNNNIETILREKTKGRSHCYAMDNAKISDIYQQLERIPVELDSPNNSIFLSAGGNDILSFYVDRQQDPTNLQFLEDTFDNYKNLVKSIRARMPNSKLFLLDIYYPYDKAFHKYRQILADWNSKVYSLSGNNIGILRISDLLTEPTDFKMGIEPSQQGGTKIVDAILTHI